MTEQDNQVKTNDWTGYKLATVIISVVSIIVIITQFIYTHYSNQRWNEIEYLKSEVVKKENELNKQRKTPKIRLNVNTVEDAGLSKQILSNLSTIPSTVSLEHVGGGTIKGLLLDIEFSESILQYQKWDSSEYYTIEKIKNANTLRIEAVRIRKDATIGVTVLTKTIPIIKTNILIDVGIIYNLENEKQLRQNIVLPEYIKEELNSNSVMSYEYVKDVVAGEKEILVFQIEVLNKIIERLRSQTLSNWWLKGIKSFIFRYPSIVLLFISIIIVSMFMLGINIDGRIRKR